MGIFRFFMGRLFNLYNVFFMGGFFLLVGGYIGMFFILFIVQVFVKLMFGFFFFILFSGQQVFIGGFLLLGSGGMYNLGFLLGMFFMRFLMSLLSIVLLGMLFMVKLGVLLSFISYFQLLGMFFVLLGVLLLFFGMIQLLLVGIFIQT